MRFDHTQTQERTSTVYIDPKVQRAFMPSNHKEIKVQKNCHWLTSRSRHIPYASTQGIYPSIYPIESSMHSIGLMLWKHLLLSCSQTLLKIVGVCKRILNHCNKMADGDIGDGNDDVMIIVLLVPVLGTLEF